MMTFGNPIYETQFKDCFNSLKNHVPFLRYSIISILLPFMNFEKFWRHDEY